MSARLSVSLFLLGIGIGSPWLVRDWLDARSDQARANRFYDSLASFPGRLKSRLRGQEEMAPLVSSQNDQVTAHRGPSPLASQTKRIMEGFLPPSLSPGEGIPFFSDASVPSTPRSQAITREVGANLREELTGYGLRLGDPLFLRLFKEEAELEVWMKSSNEPLYSLFKVIRLVDGAGQPGPKLREGDGRAPEGFYFSSPGSLRPDTRHHLGLDIAYPNAFDTLHGHTGSDLMIHGGASSAGAFAVSPSDMEDLYTLAEAGFEEGQKIIRINIFPFRMTDGRMDEVLKKRARWVDFWVNLKEGYDFFENVRLPPDVELEGGRYVFQLN